MAGASHHIFLLANNVIRPGFQVRIPTSIQPCHEPCDTNKSTQFAALAVCINNTIPPTHPT
jgi:hypothetical protein